MTNYHKNRKSPTPPPPPRPTHTTSTHLSKFKQGEIIMTPSSNYFHSKKIKKFLPKLNQLNKSKLTLATLLLFSLTFFLFDCSCESEPEVTSSTSISNRIGKYCNEDGLCFETNTIIGISNDYAISTNFSHYRYYTTSNITYYEAFISTTNLYSNLITNSVVTNYYYTSLFTNFSLHEDNPFPHEITIYNNRFYIVDTDLSDLAVYIYSTTGIYQTNFNIASNLTASGITVYNDQFYIIDGVLNKVHIYNNTGIYQTTFNLHTNNTGPAGGITTYNNNLYVNDSTASANKAYIYNDRGIYQSNFNLHTNNILGAGMTTYNNKFYITDSNDNKVYIYNNSGIYQSNFSLHSDNGNPRGITVYNNKFYISDSDKKVYIYPMQ